MTDRLDPAFETPAPSARRAATPQPARARRPSRSAAFWRRTVKYAAGLALLAIGLFATYRTVIVKTSITAVINARIVPIRSPIDGIVALAPALHGHAIGAKAAIARIADPHPDDARVFALEQQAQATQRQRTALAQRIAELKRARTDADAKAASYQAGRVRQEELQVAAARAVLAASQAREDDAADTVRRGITLHARGVQSQETYDRARHALAAAQDETLAAQKRLGAQVVALAAARAGTYLGNSYDDVTASYQRARQLGIEIADAQTTLARLGRKAASTRAALAVERRRLAARSTAVLAAPVAGRLWATDAASGEYVQKGQALMSVLDCASVLVTASVSDRVYNGLRLGDPVRFRVSGTNRAYAGHITRLGLSAGAENLAIAPGGGARTVAVDVPGLARSRADRCAVGRSGKVVFEARGGSTAATLWQSARHLFLWLQNRFRIG